MAINKISGNILADDLVRGSNLSVQGNLIYFDVANDRVGILTSTPEDQFNVVGVANLDNVRIASATANCVLYTDSGLLAKTSSNLSFDGTTLTMTGNLTVGNITLSGSSIISDTGLTLESGAAGNIVFSPDSTGLVQVDSTGGFTIPVGNTAQRPASPDTGTIRWNTSLGIVEVWDGLAWEGVGEDLAVISDQTITGDGSTLQFPLDQTTTANAIIVSTNGVVQKPATAYTVAGNVITFAEAPLSTDVIDVRFIAELSVVNAITNDGGANSISVDNSGVGNLLTLQSLQLPIYNVTQANALPNVSSGQIIYVSNGDNGNPCLAVYSVDAWKIVALGGNITT
jgi:hypothetical protein